MPTTGKPLSLYFHIPFCKKKCSYCHFYVLKDEEYKKDILLNSFEKEWHIWLPKISDKNITTVYFGGGTPSLFGPQRIEKLLGLIPKAFLNEITIEANPDDITLPLLKAFRSAGINRLSIGIQSFDDQLLTKLGRVHDAKKGIESIEAAFAAGFTNISIDLMYDIPLQSLEHWQKTLQKAIELPISHLSLYNMTIEPHTQFFRQKKLIEKELPDEETSLRMYMEAAAVLNENGLEQYEISAFARKNAISQHNVGYWTGRPFIGFGPSAFSYWEQKRFQNIPNLNTYKESLEQNHLPIHFSEELSPEAQSRERFVIELRLKKGVNLDNYSLDDEIYQIIGELIQKNFLIREENRVFLSDKGILFYDTIASELI